jgi:hypothetical protein
MNGIPASVLADRHGAVGIHLVFSRRFHLGHVTCAVSEAL